jgi:3-oxoacyl-[acyl-carrier protein] reductase
MMDFTGKVALVTGGASGIGEAATRAFAKAGAKVAFTYISSATEANALEKEIGAAGGQALAIKADLT